ncbi:hypothetical protein DPEC_G00176760 [Dallia pectoralis]|uniref:Uncharacterized protein n=1 Tax=Dallia pectoralis TaxID=75939 RepID=A0ACC2GEH1_DALPE|nr:hypothetical protein DPEC_G00176760 [Dallia pectoralis]
MVLSSIEHVFQAEISPAPHNRGTSIKLSYIWAGQPSTGHWEVRPVDSTTLNLRRPSSTLTLVRQTAVHRSNKGGLHLSHNTGTHLSPFRTVTSSELL